jgi:TolA protein
MESRLVKGLILLSLALHIAILGSHLPKWFKPKAPLVEEWQFDVDLATDFTGASPDTAIPDLKEAEEFKVDQKILPQLPKNFTVEEEKKSSEEEMALNEAEKPLEKTPQPEAKEEKKVENTPRVDIKEKLNQIKKQEALERLLKEKARQEKKFASETASPLSPKLMERSKELENREGLASGGASGTGFNQYKNQLRSAIRRHYYLPEAYNLKDADIEVSIKIMINGEGVLKTLDIYKSSGDPAFDQLALKAIQDATPFPKPPGDLAGKDVILNFSPRSIL